jgi:hypothetical protein
MIGSPAAKRADQQDAYVENVGHDPTDPPDDARWQWTYTGRPDERERLVELLQQEAEAQVADEQESLF